MICYDVHLEHVISSTFVFVLICSYGYKRLFTHTPLCCVVFVFLLMCV